MMSTIGAIRRKSAGVSDARGIALRKLSRSRTTVLHQILGWMLHAVAKRRSRVHLSELSDEQLLDIGVSPAQARQESKRFFWD